MFRHQIDLIRDHKKGVIIGIFLVIFAILFIYLFIYSGGKSCGSFECFQKSMRSCFKASYVNEEPEASWRYNILGNRKGECVVDVKLLQAKKGTLGIEKLNGFSMECSSPIGIGNYPERDLSRCHGRLKEELQTIIIEKLHVHIIENLGSIDQNLNRAF